MYIAIAGFFAAGIYGAWVHAKSEQYSDDPNNFKYCTQTFSVFTFFFTFSGDILGFLLYSFLFGRNACELCRRKIKPNQKSKYDRGDLSDAALYEDDRNYNYTRISYDLDDPIRNKLTSDMKHSINTINAPRAIENAHAHTKTKTKMANSTVYGGYTDNLLVDIGDESDDDYIEKMNKDKNHLKKLRQSTLIEAEEIISEEEYKGIREQKRVLRLIWIMLICYWVNILLIVFFGLFENVSCLTLMVSSTCMILFNDYEFGSTYWKFRKSICRMGGSLCCLCGKTYVCDDCFCGEEKIYIDNFNPITHGYKHTANHNDKSESNLPSEYKRFVRL